MWGVCITLAVSVFSIVLENNLKPITSTVSPTIPWQPVLERFSIRVEESLMAKCVVSVFEEGGRRSDFWILPWDGALWALT